MQYQHLTHSRFIYRDLSCHGFVIVMATALSVAGCSNPFAPSVQTEAKIQASVGWRLTFDGHERTGPSGSQIISLGTGSDDKCASVQIHLPGFVTLTVGEDGNKGTTTDLDRPITVCGRGQIR